MWSKPFKLTEGQRDFFFIANEQDWGLSVALTGITNRAQLFANNDLTHIAFPAAIALQKPSPCS